MQPINTSVIWQRHFGKRFLSLGNFVDFCQQVGLYSCSAGELEEYEREGWMYPAARLIMPESYAQAFWRNQLMDTEFTVNEVNLPHHHLETALRYSSSHVDVQNTDFRHPIDKAWGNIESLLKPQEHQYQSWNNYTLLVADTPVDTATHFYHYWQVYELYQIRRQHKNMYWDFVPQFPDTLEFGGTQKSTQFLDALSYFQHLFRIRYRQTVDQSTSDDDGLISFDAQQQHDLEQDARNYAMDTLAKFNLSENELYDALKRMLGLHYSYEESERLKLGETLKHDIWRLVEMIRFAFSTSPEDISNSVGFVGYGISSNNTLELLFPNRRRTTQEQAAKILSALAIKYNQETQQYSFSPQDSNELLAFVELNDLAVFEYALVELNESYFNRTSWFPSESFLRLKALASFPESLMRVVIQISGDSTLQTYLTQPTTGMGTINGLLFQHAYPSIWREYNVAGHRSASDASQFQANVNHLHTLLAVASNEHGFIGISLSLATLLRNFTSHHLIEDPGLLSGHYVHCVRAILNTAFFVWKDAKRRGWV